MRRTAALGLVGLVAASVACLEPAGPSPVYSAGTAVYSVLEVGSALVRVVAESYLETGRQPLSGATGIVSSPGGSATLTEAVDSLLACFQAKGGINIGGDEGCLAGLLPQPVAAGDPLTLRLDLPDGRVIRGSLLSPGVPIASIPADSQRVTARFQSDPLAIAIVPVVLDSAPGAERVEVIAEVERAFSGGGGATIDPWRCEVSSAAPPFRRPLLQGAHDFNLHGVICLVDGSEVGWDSLDLSLHVVAMEVNYATYRDLAHGSSSLDVTRAGFGVDGAVGVFGAVATAVVPLRVVYQP